MPERETVPGLAKLLKDVRERAGLSQADAGARSGVHPVSIARFETDARVPTLGALYKLAACYGVAVADLLPSPEVVLPPGPKKRSAPATASAPPPPAKKPRRKPVG